MFRELPRLCIIASPTVLMLFEVLQLWSRLKQKLFINRSDGNYSDIIQREIPNK